MLQQAVALSVNAKVCSLLQTCHEGEQPGEVIVRLRKQDVLKVERPSPTPMSTTLFVRLSYACPCQRVSPTPFCLMRCCSAGVQDGRCDAGHGRDKDGEYPRVHVHMQSCSVQACSY